MLRYFFPFLIILTAACSTNQDNSLIRTATLKGPSAMSMIYLIDEPPVLGKHYRTAFSVCSEPEQVKALMLDKKVEFAVLPSTMAAIIYNMTGDYLLAAIPVWGTLYLCGSDTSVHQWKDLEGKKIYLMGQGMTPDVMFRFLAEANGLEAEKYTRDYSFNGHIELANALSAGRAELGVISEPMVSLIISRNPAVRPILSFDEAWNEVFRNKVPLAQTALLVRKDFARSNPELVDEYLDLLEHCINRVNSDQSGAAALIVRHDILPDTALARYSIPLSNLKFSRAEDQVEGITEYFKVFFNFNPLIIGGQLPDEGFFYKKKDF